jgi:N-acetylmuramoyl-L-alanine amidase
MTSVQARNAIRLATAAALAAFAAMVLVMVPAATAHAAPRPFTVTIDPGHGGVYNNARYGRLYEKNVNLAIALELRRALQARGIRVIMTRTRDVAVRRTDAPTWNYDAAADRWYYAADRVTWYRGIPKDDLQARADVANKSGSDLFISVHNNGSVSAGAHGTETYATSADAPGQALSAKVQAAMVRATGLRNRGAKTMGFYVIKWANMPAILVEGGFITNAADRSIVATPWGRRRLAGAIAAGVDSWRATNPYKQYWARIGGADAYGTAAAVSAASTPATGGAVIVAAADRWADAAAAAPLARKLGAPLLYVHPAYVPAATAAELARLAPSRVIVLGGEGSVDATAFAAVAQASGVPTSAVERIGGSDRYETAGLVARLVGLPASRSFALVSGRTAADAVAASAYAAGRGMPLLLTNGSVLSTETASFIASSAPASTLIVGGTGAVSAGLASRMPSPSRVAGADRFWTNKALVDRAAPSGVVRCDVASADSPAEAIVAGVHAARTGRQVMLTGNTRMSEAWRLWIENGETRLGSVTMIGGTTTLPYLHDQMILKALR